MTVQWDVYKQIFTFWLHMIRIDYMHVIKNNGVSLSTSAIVHHDDPPVDISLY